MLLLACCLWCMIFKHTLTLLDIILWIRVTINILWRALVYFLMWYTYCRLCMWTVSRYGSFQGHMMSGGVVEQGNFFWATSCFTFWLLFQKWNLKMTWKWRQKGAFVQNGPIPLILQRASFLCSFSSSLFVVLSNSTPTPNFSLHHHQWRCLPHTSTTTTPSPPAVITPMPTPTLTNGTNCRKPTT